jgi:dTDP-4-dehydrorhamnose reductase
MRVVVLGAGGQLGVDTSHCCSAHGDHVITFTHEQLDVTQRDAVLAALTSTKPDVVVNCAAWTNVDGCEGDPDRALAVNGMAVRFIAEACDRAGSHLVQLSTDYVFDGELDRPYHEWDSTAPLSVYGMTKLVGEHEALMLGVHAVIVRTSWVCGMHGSNMAKTVMRLAEQHPQLSFVTDQIGHPTFTHDLAVALRALAVDRCSGVWHVTNQRPTSWFGFAREVVAAMGKDPAMVQPIVTADLQPPRPAPRPANSVLDNAMWRISGRAAMRDFGEPLAETVRALLAQ